MGFGILVYVRVFRPWKSGVQDFRIDFLASHRYAACSTALRSATEPPRYGLPGCIRRGLCSCSDVSCWQVREVGTHWAAVPWRLRVESQGTPPSRTSSRTSEQKAKYSVSHSSLREVFGKSCGMNSICQIVENDKVRCMYGVCRMI